ncbi:MAG: hypothetical protein ACLU0O_04775 [Collinsella sp.]
MARLRWAALSWSGVARLPRAEWTSRVLRVMSCSIAAARLAACPLRRIASGGELSRVLASKVVLGNADGVDTLVFDEVDAGVGGSAACLASVLADLAVTHQVIVVTHLARSPSWPTSITSVKSRAFPRRTWTGDDAVQIARMLSGGKSIQRPAKQMLEEARA